LSKQPASPDLYRRRDNLRRMAEGGTEHEKCAAHAKLKRLEARHDFSSSSAPEMADIFSNWIKPKPAAVALSVLKVPDEWADAANLVKWAFADRFDTASVWRNSTKGAELLVHAEGEDVGNLRPLAKGLFKSIEAACVAFHGKGKVAALSRAPFLQGVYDGIMDESRTAGSVIPGFSPAPKKQKGRKSRRPVANAAAVHPYELGRTVGLQIRVNIPRKEISAGIRLAMKTVDEPDKPGTPRSTYD